MHTPNKVPEFEVIVRESRVFGPGCSSSHTRAANFSGTEDECNKQALRLQESFQTMQNRGLTIKGLALHYFIRETGKTIDAD